MSYGDFNFFQRFYTSRNKTQQVVAATDDTTLITVKSASHQLWIQRISIEITTYAARTWTFTDSAGTPVPIKHISIPAAAVALPSESNTIICDYGPEGIPLTVGTNLLLDVSAAGAAGIIHVESYERLGVVISSYPPVVQ